MEKIQLQTAINKSTAGHFHAVVAKDPETFGPLELICSWTNKNTHIHIMPTSNETVVENWNIFKWEFKFVSPLLKSPSTVLDHVRDTIYLLKVGPDHLHTLLSCLPSSVPAPLLCQTSCFIFWLPWTICISKNLSCFMRLQGLCTRCFHYKTFLPLPPELLFILLLGQFLLQKGFPDPLSQDSPSALRDISAVPLITL